MPSARASSTRVRSPVVSAKREPTKWRARVTNTPFPPDSSSSASYAQIFPSATGRKRRRGEAGIASSVFGGGAAGAEDAQLAANGARNASVENARGVSVDERKTTTSKIGAA